MTQHPHSFLSGSSSYQVPVTLASTPGGAGLGASWRGPVEHLAFPFKHPAHVEPQEATGQHERLQLQPGNALLKLRDGLQAYPGRCAHGFERKPGRLASLPKPCTKIRIQFVL